MALFKKTDPVTDAERALDDLKRRETNLRVRLEAAQGDLAAAVADRRDLLTVGDISDEKCAAIDRRVSKLKAAADGLSDAVATLAGQRAEAEAELEAMKDQGARQAEAKRVAAVRADLRERLLAVEAAVEAVIPPLAEMPIGRPAAHLASQFRDGFTVLGLEILRQLEAHRARLIDGTAALPAPAPAALHLVEPTRSAAQESAA